MVNAIGKIPGHVTTPVSISICATYHGKVVWTVYS